MRQMSFRASLKRTLYTRPGWTSGTIVAIDAPYRSRIAGWVRVRKRKLATVAVVVLVVAVTSAVIVARTDNPRFLTVTPRGNFTLDEAERFEEFPVYSVGSSFRGLPLNAVIRTKGNRPASDPARHDTLTFMYGTCDIPLWRGKADGGCGVPLGIQNWPACLRSINVTGPPNLDELVTVRGVLAIFSEGYSKLALIIGETTVFV